jgi:beta-lactamase superfamily II metal-dependent hydrolase
MMSVISAGEDNRFSHLDEAVVARLMNVVLHNNILLTSKIGDIQFTTDGIHLWVDTKASP